MFARGINRSLVTVLRFYNQNLIGINTFAQDMKAEDTVHKIDRFLRCNCNFLGDCQVDGDELGFVATNENNSFMKQAQGFQSCKASGSIKNPTHLLLKLTYPQMNGPFREFNKEGEFVFEFHPVSFAETDTELSTPNDAKNVQEQAPLCRQSKELTADAAVLLVSDKRDAPPIWRTFDVLSPDMLLFRCDLGKAHSNLSAYKYEPNLKLTEQDLRQYAQEFFGEPILDTTQYSLSIFRFGGPRTGWLEGFLVVALKVRNPPEAPTPPPNGYRPGFFPTVLKFEWETWNWGKDAIDKINWLIEEALPVFLFNPSPTVCEIPRSSFEPIPKLQFLARCRDYGEYLKIVNSIEEIARLHNATFQRNLPQGCPLCKCLTKRHPGGLNPREDLYARCFHCNQYDPSHTPTA